MVPGTWISYHLQRQRIWVGVVLRPTKERACNYCFYNVPNLFCWVVIMPEVHMICSEGRIYLLEFLKAEEGKLTHLPIVNIFI